MDTKTFFKLFIKHFPVLPMFQGNNIVDLLNDLRRSQTTIDQKVERVSESLKETSVVIDELESELLERQSKLIKLQEEYERYSHLSKMEEENATAVINQFEHSIGKRTKKDLWVNIVISITIAAFFFILGIFIGS